jgi:hypothetical protein
LKMGKKFLMSLQKYKIFRKYRVEKMWSIFAVFINNS